MKEEIKENKKKLEDERENIIQIENYTRRENLKIMNIPESEEEGKSFEANDVVYSILQNELGIDTANIRFHAVHRIGKPKRNKIRPLIVRFVYKHQEFRASGLCAVHCGISETEKWAPTLEEQPY